MTLHPHHPDNYTRDQKKDVLRGIIAEAYEEQVRPKRVGYLLPGDPFEMRINNTERRERLIDVLSQTEALELLAEMVGVIDEEVQ
ncbi:hypothetical protein SEA_PIONEER3_14 [Microbacterium phage Pioneer3]|nr:hypothetical protein SEA_PIONEER3_14 [Microbacterium phage Pioneer3]